MDRRFQRIYERPFSTIELQTRQEAHTIRPSHHQIAHIHDNGILQRRYIHELSRIMRVFDLATFS